MTDALVETTSTEGPANLPAVAPENTKSWEAIQASTLGDRMKRALQRVAGGGSLRDARAVLERPLLEPGGEGGDRFRRFPHPLARPMNIYSEKSLRGGAKRHPMAAQAVWFRI
jgi:hypothetical protein